MKYNEQAVLHHLLNASIGKKLKIYCISLRHIVNFFSR